MVLYCMTDLEIAPGLAKGGSLDEVRAGWQARRARSDAPYQL
jgi:hypothetical protein